MTNHKDNPAEIYLVPMLGDDHDHIWCQDPAPGEGMREEDATRYVRADLVPASNEVLARRVVELTNERDALAAQVEQLRSGLNQAIELLVTALIEPEQITDTEISELRDIEQATPAQCLAEVKAQAGRDGFIAGATRVMDEYCAPRPFFLERKADKYANQLRQSAKAGE